MYLYSPNICSFCRQSEKANTSPPKPDQQTSKPEPGLLGSAQNLLQPQHSKQSSASTGMLFALQSMAKHMSPVLSSYVSHQQAQDQSDSEHSSEDQQGRLRP